MTETDWLKTNDVEKMVAALRRSRVASPRKYGLFGCACCRSVWDLLDGTTRLGVEVAERWADEAITDDEWREVPVRVHAEMEATPERRTVYRAVAALLGPEMTAGTVLDMARLVGIAAHRATGVLTTRQAQPGLLRDIFGPLPFRTVVIDTSWLTATVASLARGIYDEKAFDRLPILADALTDAGCSNDDLLDHLRGPGPHVRGCWVVDSILGKT